MTLFWWLVVFGVGLAVAGAVLTWALCVVSKATDALFEDWVDEDEQ